MYQPRRGALAAEAESFADASQPVAGQLGAPRRVASRPRSQVGLRAGIGFAALAITATAGTVALTTSPATVSLPAPTSSPQGRDLAALNRSAVRTVQVRQLSESKLAEATADLTSVTPMYTTATLNLRKAASSKSGVVTSIASGSKVLATSTIEGDYRRVESGKATGWVLAARLTDNAPDPVPSGFSAAPCAQGSAVEGRLRSDTIRIHRAVCALFPGVNSYGGWRAGGLPFHRNGRALDIMLTPGAESALGHRIANYLIANAKAFNIDHIIFEQQIWTPRTPHWRHMADRGGITANHFDHVHVAIRA